MTGRGSDSRQLHKCRVHIARKVGWQVLTSRWFDHN